MPAKTIAYQKYRALIIHLGEILALPADILKPVGGIAMEALKFGIFLAIVIAHMTACGESSDGTKRAGQIGGSTPIGTPASGTGQLVFETSDRIDSSTVEGYVVGKQDELKVEKVAEGKFVINDIPAGQVDVVVTGRLAVEETGLIDEASQVGIRKNNVLIISGDRSSPGDFQLQAMGSINGYVYREGTNNHEGIFVSIPGTHYGTVRTTDAEGFFSFEQVPPGEHRLLFQSSGYRDGRIESFDVRPSQSATIETMRLYLSTGADGTLVINGGASYSNELTVDLAINATDDAVLMKISEDINFSGLVWEPLVSFRKWTFSSPGRKTLYIKFADANGLETSPSSAVINIDFFSDNVGEVNLEFDLQTANRSIVAANFLLQNISVPPMASAMKVYDVTRETEASWVPLSETASFSFANHPDNCGSHVLGLKFRTANQVESEELRKEVKVTCWSQSSNLGRPPIGSSSFIEAWTGSRLLVWGGYTMDDMDYLFWDHGYVYDQSADTWSAMSTVDQPSQRTDPGFAYFPDKLILFGGANDFSCDRSDGFIYTESTDSWSTISTVGAPSGRCPAISRGFIDAVTGDEKVIFWSGNVGGVMSASGGIYNVNTNSWQTMDSTDAPVRNDSYNAFTTVIGSKFYLFGGRYDDSCEDADYEAFWAYDLLDEAWETLPGPPDIFDVSPCDITIHGFEKDKIIYIIASRQPRTESKERELIAKKFDVDTETWSEWSLDQGPSNLDSFASVLVGDKILVIGGKGEGLDGGEFSDVEPSVQNKVYSYNISKSSWSSFQFEEVLGRSGARSFWNPTKGLVLWHGTFPKGKLSTTSLHTYLGQLP